MTTGTDGSHALDLETVRWHILRGDAQRVGLWTRAAAILGADTLVLAGATVLLTQSPAEMNRLSSYAAMTTMVLVLTSVVRAAQVIGTVKDWGRTIESQSPPPALYSLPETVKMTGSYATFRELARTQSREDQFESAVSELWRLACLHQRRILALRAAGVLLLLAIIALVLSGAIFIVVG